MSIPLLLGPISIGNGFMLTSIQNSVPYFLNGASDGTGMMYYWESSLTILQNGSTVPVFTAVGTTGSLVLTDTTNGGNLGFSTTGNYIINSPNSENVIMEQGTYADWDSPDILLSMAVYSIENESEQPGNIYTSPSPIANSIPADNIVVVPITWYFGCTTSGGYNDYNTPAGTLSNWMCVVNGTVTGCSGTNPTSSGWTNLADCITGDQYTYCPINKTCGSNNCKGPCSTIYDDCNYTSSKTYVCQFDSDKYFTETKWWTTPYFIGIVIGLVVLILVLIIVIFGTLHKKRILDSNESAYNIEQ